MYYTVRAVVLRSMPLGEADALYILYTKEFGKIAARASGIKKEEAKLRGHLETLVESTVGCASGKNGERIIHARLERFWEGIRRDTESVREALRLLSLIDTHCLDGDRDVSVWELLTSALERLDSGGVGPDGFSEFRRMFEARLVALLGYGEDQGLRILPTYTL